MQAGANQFSQWGAGGTMQVAGLVQFAIGMNEMKKLNRQKWEQYALGANSSMALNESIKRAKSGYSPEEIAGFQGRITRASNTAYNKGINYGGGNLASAVSQGIQYANMGAQQEFSLHDAEMRRRNIMDRDRLIAYEQQLKNLNTAQAIDIRKGKIAGAQNLINTGATNFMNGTAIAGGGQGGQQAGYVQQTPTDNPNQQQQQQAPVDYNPNNSGYNQGYNSNQWLYGYANQGQQPPVYTDPYQTPPPVTPGPNNYTW